MQPHRSRGHRRALPEPFALLAPAQHAPRKAEAAAAAEVPQQELRCRTGPTEGNALPRHRPCREQSSAPPCLRTNFTGSSPRSSESSPPSPKGSPGHRLAPVTSPRMRPLPWTRTRRCGDALGISLQGWPRGQRTASSQPPLRRPQSVERRGSEFPSTGLNRSVSSPSPGGVALRD